MNENGITFLFECPNRIVLVSSCNTHVNEIIQKNIPRVEDTRPLSPTAVNKRQPRENV